MDLLVDHTGVADLADELVALAPDLEIARAPTVADAVGGELVDGQHQVFAPGVRHRYTRRSGCDEAPQPSEVVEREGEGGRDVDLLVSRAAAGAVQPYVRLHV